MAVAVTVENEPDFANGASVSQTDFAGLKRVEINGEVFFWPPNSPLDALLQMAAELCIANHPHQYLWGPTRLLRATYASTLVRVKAGLQRGRPLSAPA